MFDLNARLRRNVGPDIARSHRPLPALAALLAGHCHEAEIADGGAIGRGIPVYDDNAQALFAGSKRVGEANNSSANNGEII